MNILDVLREEHEMVDELFQAIKGAQDEGEKNALVNKLVDALSKHTRAEEQAVYSTMQDSDLLSHATEEHREADSMLRKLDGIAPDNPNFDSYLGALEESVKHHVEEEETKVFDHLREIHDEETLEELADDFEAAKGE